MDITLAEAWIQAIATAIDSHKDHLTQLDSAIGDADHGFNMHRGFSAARIALDGLDAATVGAVFVKTGITLVSSVGGASGPLYGTVFRGLGGALDVPRADAGQFAHALAVGLERVQKLGAAQPGDKTMIDAYLPALADFRQQAEHGADFATAADAAARAALDGMEATTPLRARKGRASYLGARSIGHQDPGAASTALIFRALADVVRAA